MIKRSPPRRRRPGPPRRGRIVDLKFMAFARKQGCILRGIHTCRGPMTFHHVRAFGGQKSDRHGVGLCAAGHLHSWSMTNIERLGKVKFEELWDIDLGGEIERLNVLWEATK